MILFWMKTNFHEEYDTGRNRRAKVIHEREESEEEGKDSSGKWYDENQDLEGCVVEIKQIRLSECSSEH